MVMMMMMIMVAVAVVMKIVDCDVVKFQRYDMLAK